MSSSPRPIPRVAAIHDLSGFGRCALAAVIPAISALGIQVCPIPTAVLSTQTDGFENFTFRDLTQDVYPIFSHWSSLGISMDCIYSGFLGSFEQISIVRSIFEHSPGALRVVDPVMGDDGALYATMSDEMGYRMRELCSMADVITPNLTECICLLDRPYEARPLSAGELRRHLKDLCALGAKIAVLTGVVTEDGMMANCAYDSVQGVFSEARSPLLPRSYPGTGDLFTSVLTGLLVLGVPLSKALVHTTDYLAKTISLTIEMGTPVREGVALERTLPLLTQLVSPGSPLFLD